MVICDAMKGAGATVLTTRTMTMMKRPTQAGRIRREASAAQISPKRFLVNKVVIQAVANKTKTKGERATCRARLRRAGHSPCSHEESGTTCRARMRRAEPLAALA